MPSRSAFLAGSAAFLASARVANATGGLDVGDPGGEPAMRVLLASGAFASPQRVDQWHFAWEGRVYRGSAASVALGDGSNGLVNSLPLDAYLYGVLSAEVGASWPRAALEAQAIVSRTYALGRLRPSRAYDVVASESDQRYGGVSSETVEGRSAVDATSGSIVTFGGTPAHVAYSACCGGHTAAAGDVWGVAYDYLRGVPDPYCAVMPDFRWTADVPSAALERALGASYDQLGSLRGVALGASDSSGRPRTLRFDGAAGDFEIATTAFRERVGPSLVRSTLLTSATPVRDGLALSGTGRGHGVGLCQWGARALAASGSGAKDIVAFYFPGTALGHAETGPVDPTIE
jgi:stage II sporulation protein D